MVSQAGADPLWPRVSVVVPTLNEEKNLPYVFSRLPANVHEVIVVDGHSVDGTIAVARQLRPGVLVVQQTRTGKGNALACGFAAATGDDHSHGRRRWLSGSERDPEVRARASGGADFAKGTRFAAGGGSSDITRLRKLGNRLLGAVVNLSMERTTQISAMGSTCSGRSMSQFWALTSPLPLHPGATGGCGAMASRSRR